MPTITVYRLEHKDRGCGPYRDEGLDEGTRDLLCLAHSGHLDPWKPGEPWEEWANTRDAEHLKEEKFGFLYLEDLYQWFGEAWMELLTGCGYIIKVYEIPVENIKLGAIQVSFREQDESTT